MHAEPPLIPEVYVSNIKTSLSFYQDILGFQVLYQRPEEGFAKIEREGAIIMLEEVNKDSKRCWITDDLTRPFGRGINFQIQVSDVLTLYDTVKRINHAFYVDLEEKWYRANNQEAGNKQFVIQDPDGYLLRFFEDMGMRDIK